MNDITRRAVRAFWRGTPFKQNNTIVRVDNSKQEVRMYLHGNLIASRPLADKGELFLSDCGYQTGTTKRRLNELLRTTNMQIFQRRGQWYVQLLPDYCEEWKGIIKVGYNSRSA